MEVADHLGITPEQEREPVGSRRRGRPSISNEELLDKALDLFLENGFERTSIDAITAAAGVAKRTIYMRYGDKEKLFKAALRRAIEEWIVPTEALRAVETDSIEETLLAVGRILVANMMRPAGLRLLRITNAESGRWPEIGAYTFRQGTEPTIAYLTDLLCRHFPGENAASLPHEEAARAFLYLTVGGLANMAAWGIEVDEATMEKHVTYSVNLFLYGLTTGTDKLSSQAGVAVRSAEWDLLVNREGRAPEALDVTSLQNENRQLKKLLVDALLEAATLKDQLERR